MASYTTDQSMPSAPPNDQAYSTTDNPVSKGPSEDQASSYNDEAFNAGKPIERRIPQQQSESSDDAVPTSKMRGVRDPNARGEEQYGLTEEDVGRHNELDAEQMAAPGEGKVANAVLGRERTGGTGGQEGFESDLDRKKAEQAPLREAREEGRRQEVDVAGVLGQTGGPANPVDKNGYPNSGSS